MLERTSVGALALIAAGLALAALANIPRDARPMPASPASPAPPSRPPAPSPTPAAVQALRDGAAIDLNLAAVGDLELLPGIGPALAQRIVAERQAHGAFVRVGDLHRVHGIGPRTIARLQTLVRIETAPAAGARSTPARRADSKLSGR